MKKIIALLLALLMCMSLCNCGNSGKAENQNSKVSSEMSEPTNTPETTKTSEPAVTSSAQEPITYKLGDTVSTDVIEFTLDRAELAFALHDGTAGDRDKICMPKEFEQDKDDNQLFVAAIGHTMVSVQFTLSNKNRVEMLINEDTFASVDYDGSTYSDCDLTTGFYSNRDLRDWDGVDIDFTEIDAGDTLSYRCGVDVPVEVSDLTDSFVLTIGLPTSKGDFETFSYSVTKDDLDVIKNQELPLEEAIEFFGYDDGYDYFVKHMDEYSDMSTEEIMDALVGNTYKCYFMGEKSHMETVGVFQDDGQFAYAFKNAVYTVPYTIDEGVLTVSHNYPGTVRRISDSAFLMVGDGKPCGMISQVVSD